MLDNGGIAKGLRQRSAIFYDAGAKRRWRGGRALLLLLLLL